MMIQEHPIVKQIEKLSDIDKLQLLDMIWEQLDRPDPEIDWIWANEARTRWQAYKNGELTSVSYEEVMSRYKTL